MVFERSGISCTVNDSPLKVAMEWWCACGYSEPAGWQVMDAFAERMWRWELENAE